MGVIASKCILFIFQAVATLTGILVCHWIYIYMNKNSKTKSKESKKKNTRKNIDSKTNLNKNDIKKSKKCEKRKCVKIEDCLLTPEKSFRTDLQANENDKQIILKPEKFEETNVISHTRQGNYYPLKDDIIKKPQTRPQNNNAFNNFKEKKIRPQSLMNIGSTCYLNSALQGISSCSKFVEEITNLVNESQSKYQKLSIFHDLILILNDKTVANRIEISRNAIFRDWNKPGQQDSFELLAYVLNEVYGDIRKCKEKNGEIKKDIQEWLKEKLPMRIIIRYGIICGNGHKIKMPLQSDLALHVPISWNLNLNLQNFVDSYFKDDKIQDYACDENGCNSADCHRTTRLVLPLPRTICVHLQRTFCKNRKMIKINENIKFDNILKIKSRFCVERNEDNDRKNLEQNLIRQSSIEIGNERNGKENVIGGHDCDDLINDGLNNENEFSKESVELGALKKNFGENEENTESNKVTENGEKLLYKMQCDENLESTSQKMTDIQHEIGNDSFKEKEIMEEKHDGNEEPRSTRSVEDKDMKEKESKELGDIKNTFSENEENNESNKVSENGEKLLYNSQEIEFIKTKGDENRELTLQTMADFEHKVGNDSLKEKEIMEEKHDGNEELRSTRSIEDEDMKEKEPSELRDFKKIFGENEENNEYNKVTENREKLLYNFQEIEVIKTQGDENRELTLQIMADFEHKVGNDSLKEKEIMEEKHDRNEEPRSNVEKHFEASKEIIEKEIVENKICGDINELTIQLHKTEVIENKYNENAKPKSTNNAQDKGEYGNYSNKEKQNYSENVEDNEKHEIFYLTSVIVHYGSAHGGHYVCYKCIGKRWFLTNDSEVREVNEAEVLNCQAYILFYEKP